MKKVKFVSFLIVFVLLLQLLTAQSFAVSPSSNNKVTVTVLCNDKSVDLTNIEVDVYSAQLSYSDPTNGHFQYNETYAFTKNIGSDGKLIFDRPSEACSISIKIETLPENYGVTEHTHFFLADASAYTVVLDSIESVSVVEEDGQPFAIFTGKSGNIVYLDALVTKTSESTYEIQNNTIVISSNYLVVYGNHSQKLSYEKPYTFINEAEKATILYKNALISESEYIEEIAEWCLSNKTNSTQSSEYARILQNYVEKNPEQPLAGSALQAYDENLSNQAMVMSANTEDYVYSASGRFRVYYPSDDYLNAATLIAAHYDEIDAMLCTTLGLNQPDCAIDWDSGPIMYTHYRIYIIDYENDDDPTNDGNAAMTPLSYAFPGMSYINIDANTARNIVNADLFPLNKTYTDAIGTLAHEYMHAILYAYGIPYDTEVNQWMHESFSTFVGSIYEPSYYPQKKSAAETYLSQTYISMPYTDDPYGAFLFPLYIYEECGGMDTIKAILTAYAASESAITAINAGLQAESSYTLATAFPRYAAFNCDTDYYYDLIDEEENDISFPSNSISNTYNSYPTASLKKYVGYLSYSTLKYAPANTASATLIVTADFSSYSGAGLYSVRTNLMGNSNTTKTMQAYVVGASGRCTIVQYGFSSSNYESLLVIPSNANTSGTIDCTISATLE